MALDFPLMLALVSAIGAPSCDTNLVHTPQSGILMPTECTPGLRSGLSSELRSNISVNGPGRRSFSISSPTEQFAHLYNIMLWYFSVSEHEIRTEKCLEHKIKFVLFKII